MRDATRIASPARWERHELALSIAAMPYPLADRLAIAAGLTRLGYTARQINIHIDAAVTAAREIRRT